MTKHNSPPGDLATAIHHIGLLLESYDMAGLRTFARGRSDAPETVPPSSVTSEEIHPTQEHSLTPTPVREEEAGGKSQEQASLPPPSGQDMETVLRDDTGQAPRISAENLEAIRRDMGECTRCRLHKERHSIVFGEGSENPSLVFVGEGPGFDEDRQGRPFVGRAGKLLDKMIASIGYDRTDVYICNVVKCRPPDNRTPQHDEIQTCTPFLVRQLTALAPKVICALGACAAQTLLGTSKSISSIRGKAHSWRGVPLICTYHPAYLLRTPAQKAPAWQDLLLVRSFLERAPGGRR